MFILATYDIVSNRRRERVSDILHAHDPRVQQSVFELDLNDHAALVHLMQRVHGLLDDDEDQIRFYIIAGQEQARHIIGDRRLEERQAFYIL
ncbi:CRISPR-associated endonuclease Cas2 [Dietzia sp. SYD-A1]|uniref:CRISPR-associated endonuclease Cas2 n=1 Tax=Dietzia sp. SYD-A1 TaxID=2780141 RepID=UPI001E619BC0|nr:CRISPR-associated endonuclease Cas2 [Dietzia sp. SYD-A1]